MASYVLIVVSMFSGYAIGNTVTFQEFLTKEKCESAILAFPQPRYYIKDIKMVCVEK